jgi:hypothetical protein
MTWIYIPDSTFSTVSADTADSVSGFDSPTRTQTSAQSPISSGTNTASKSSRPGSETATSMTLPSGTTSKVSTADPGVERWIFSVLASRVNLTQMRASAGAPQMTEIFFPTPSESLGRWDPDSSSWRTSQASLFDLTMDGKHMAAPWSESWPKSGMTRSGELYPLPTQERHTSATGGGSWPTPTGSDQIPRTTTTFLRYRGWDLATAAAKWHIPTLTSADVYTGNMESSQQSDDSMHSVSLPDFVSTSSWKMSQVSLWEDDPTFGTFSADFPRSGFMNADGMLYRLKMPKRLINGPAGGASPVWMTPNTMDALSAKSQQALDHEHETARPGRSNPNNLRDQVSVSEGHTMWPTPDSSPRGSRASDLVAENGRSVSRRTSGQQRGIDLQTSVRMFPTPVADGDRQTNYQQGGTALGVAARMFPTPRAGKTTDEDEESWLARHADGKVATPPLALAARMLPSSSSGGESGGPHGIRGGSWPTPRTSEIAAKHTMQQIRNRINQSGYHSNLEELVALETPAQGSLSPDWVEWLMGTPLGWTSMQPLSSDEYLYWLHAQQNGTWWQIERGLPRVATGIPNRVNRLKCLGNGIVPASLSLFLRGTR